MNVLIIITNTRIASQQNRTCEVNELYKKTVKTTNLGTHLLAQIKNGLMRQ